MSTNTSVVDEPIVDTPPPTPDDPQSASAESRIDWLFRDAARNQCVHPLKELVRRYRQQESS